MKIKILITNHSLSKYRGSEKYCYDMAKELSKNNDVFVWSPEKGKLSEEMESFCKVLDNPIGLYDLVFFNHNNTVNDKIKAKCKIYTIHGIFPDLERPPNGMDIYVGISEEVATFYKEINPYVIMNGIDSHKYNVENSKIFKKNVLFISNYKSRFSILLLLVCLSLGLSYKRIGGSGDKNKQNVVDYINWADIVVGIGRTALEAMSCNKKIIVADKRPYSDFGMDGFLTKENIEHIKKFNFSGRCYKRKIAFLSLRRELRKALMSREVWERNWILNNCKIDKVVNSYMELARHILVKKNEK